MTTNSSAAASRTEAGTVRVGTGRTARAHRSTGAAPVVRYADAAGRARTAGPDTAASFVALTADDIDRDHGVALLEAAGHGVRILTQLTVDQHDTAFGARPWPVTEAEQLHGSADAIRVAVGGQWYELTRVQMPSGERRRFARQYNGYGDGPKDVREASMMFGCAWSSVPVVGWTEAEVEAEHEADAERMDYIDAEAERLGYADAAAYLAAPGRVDPIGPTPCDVCGVQGHVERDHGRPVEVVELPTGNPNCCSHGYRFENGLCPVVVCGASPWTPAPDPPHAAGAGLAVTTYRTDPQT